MNLTSDPAATVPASRLRARPVNTSHTAPAKTSTKSSVTKRVASPKSSTVRPRTPATTTTTAPVTSDAHHSLSSSSVTRRARGHMNPVAPGRSQLAAAAGEKNTTAAALTSIPTNTSHMSGRGGNTAHPSLTGAPLGKTSSRTNRTAPGAAAMTTTQYSSGRVSRLDSVCSSLPGANSDRGSVHRLRVPPQHPPPVPHLSAMPRPAPLTRAATAECVLRSARQQTAVTADERGKRSTPPPQTETKTETKTEREAVARVQSSPRRAGRSVATAPASRVSSVNSRLADPHTPAPAATTSPATVTTRAPRTRVVRTAGKRSASSNSDLGATAPPNASTAFTTVPPRAAGVRPLLPAGRRVALHRDAHAMTASAVARQRTRNASAAQRSSSSASQAESGSRSARGGNGAPLSGRRVAGASPTRKAAPRRASEAADGAVRIPPPSSSSSKFQQTHTGCPPPLSFGGSAPLRGKGGAAAVSTATRGPVSPIKRTSTACPSGAQVYPPVAPCDEDAAGLHGSPHTAGDAAFACPWLKPGAFSTPTNRDGGRESSEAPTVPYEGSTGQRASMSLSPRTDFDTASVSGRLSYGM